MSQQRKAEKNQEAIRKIGLLDSNRECMDCTLKSTPYVVLDFGTFVCTFCAGVHRTHTFQAKGISMTNFKDTEVQFMKSHGNAPAEKVWRASFRGQKPKITEEAKIKQFIHDTYVSKKFYSRSGSPSPSNGSANNTPVDEGIPEPQPIQKILKDPAKIEVTRTSTRQPTKTEEPKRAKQEASFFDFTDEPVATQTHKQPQTTNSNFFFDDNTTTTNHKNGFGDDADFEVDFNDAPVSTQPPQQQKKDGLSLADELFANIPTTAPQQTFGNNFMQQQQHTQHQTGGLDDFFGGGNTGFTQPNPYNNGYSQPYQQTGFQQQQGWNQPQMNQQYPTQPRMSSPPQTGFQQQQGWNQPPMNQQMWNQPYNAPMTNQPMQRGPPQVNPVFSEPPKQQQVHDPFAGLGGFGASTTTNTQPKPPQNTYAAHDDNPFDF